MLLIRTSDFGFRNLFPEGGSSGLWRWDLQVSVPIKEKRHLTEDVLQELIMVLVESGTRLNDGMGPEN